MSFQAATAAAAAGCCFLRFLCCCHCIRTPGVFYLYRKPLPQQLLQNPANAATWTFDGLAACS